MKVAFFELEEWEKTKVKSALKGHQLLFFDTHLDEKNIKQIKDVDAIIIFIYSSVTKQIIDQLPKLKLIATMSTGYEHIDVNYCKEKGIIVCNIPTYGENTVAEHTFALILALSRKLYLSIKRTHEQQIFETDESLRGFDLKGKTLGIIGLGNIGNHVARIGVGFEMNVLVHTRHPDDKLAKKVGFKNVDFNTLLKNSDIITIHVPLVKATQHMIDANAIAEMKKGVYIINTARGGLIDTDALLKALQDGKVAGAALDVLEEECAIREERELLHKKFKATRDFRTVLEEHVLMKMNNVIITPHNAFNSDEALHRIIDATINNILEYIKKKNCVNQVK